jgi:D-serine dehydratase
LVYKPCGAGGGDIGIAFGFEPEALNRFCQQVTTLKFINLDMEMALNGVKAT